MAGERSGRGDAEYAAAIAEVWAHSQELMRGRVAVLEETARAVLDGQLAAEQRQLGEREAHKLAGSLGSFGLSEGSRLAREVEWLLRGSKPVAAGDALRLSELVVALGHELATGPTLNDPAAGAPAGTASILVVDADGELAHRLVEEASARQLRPVAVDSATAARDSIAASRPDLVLVDPAGIGESDGGRAFLAELCQATDPVPVIVLTAPGNKVDRAEAARLGSSGYLEKPLSPRKVIEVVSRLLERLRPGSGILVVGDDPATPEILRRVLGPRGLRVEALDEPPQFWSTLQRVRPALLVLDIGSPPREGLRLCRMVRGDTTWEQLPVVFLIESPGNLRTEMFRAGADDVVAKPVTGEDLAVQITNRLERNRLRQGSGETDPRTGLAGWPQLELELRRLLAMAARYGQLLAVAVLAVDTPPQPEGPYEPAAGQAVRLALGRLLRQSFRIEDAVGERGDQHLVVALYGAEPAGAIERLASILETFRAEQVTFGDGRLRVTASAGLATYPVDGARVDALVDSATAAMQAAQSMGGDRVQTVAGDEPPPYGSVDVLVVDDDDALVPLLLHALSTRGYRTHWLKDGAEAVALLLAPDGLRARVILLDVGLPGLDGLSVLRELANTRTLDRCRVIMVTLRSGEQEVLQALELGAFDHMAKPLSIPVLLHRVRHAIESLQS